GILAAGAIGGAAAGAATGLLTGGTGTVPLAALGAVKGTMMAYAPFRFRDTYQISAGQVYHELKTTLKDNGNAPKAEEERKAIARGAGALMASVEMLPVGVIAKNIPWVKNLTRGNFSR